MKTVIVLIVGCVVYVYASVHSTGTNVVVVNTNPEDRKQKSALDGQKLVKFRPDWDDLDTRPLPQWYDRAKIGVFLHWGVYSVPSFKSEWFWEYWKTANNTILILLLILILKFMAKNYPPGFAYQEFAPMFKAEFWDPAKWAKLFKKAGLKYVVLTSKHHEGFTLFPSKQSFGWNAMDVGPHRDLVGDLADAVRKEGLEFGLYHSLFEWYNPLYLEDKSASFKTRKFSEHKLWPDLKQIVNDYKPSVIWSDGDLEAEDTYWNSTSFLAWLYNDSPVRDRVVVNDRWGKGTAGKHGDFWNCQDKYNPGVLQKHKWENAFTLDRHSWGYRRTMNIHDVFTMEELTSTLASTISCGGNALINVGPTKEGTIVPIFEERLLALGKWLEVNGEAIYGSSPWLHQNDTINSHVWYTCTKQQYHARRAAAKPMASDKITAVYAIILKWPKNGILELGAITPQLHEGTYQVQLLGHDGSFLKWHITNGVSNIQLPEQSYVDSKYAWTLKFTKNS